MSLLQLFRDVDDFCQYFEAWAKDKQLPAGRKRGPKPSLTRSEVMTILIHFHQQGYRDFKSYYPKHVLEHLRGEFPGLVFHALSS